MVTLKEGADRVAGQSLQHTEKSPRKGVPTKYRNKEQACVTEPWRKKKNMLVSLGVWGRVNSFASQLGATSHSSTLGFIIHTIQELLLSVVVVPTAISVQEEKPHSSRGCWGPLPNPLFMIMVVLRQLEQNNESKMVARGTTHWVNKTKRL